MRFCLMIGMLAVMAASFAYLDTASAADEDVKDVKGCMAFQNKVRGDLGKMASAKTPDWDEIQKETKNWVKVSESIGSFKPPKGDDASWKEQTDKYKVNVKAVDEAATKKSSEDLKKGLAAVQASCGGCHGKHKPKK